MSGATHMERASLLLAEMNAINARAPVAMREGKFEEVCAIRDRAEQILAEITQIRFEQEKEIADEREARRAKEERSRWWPW